MAEFIYTVGAGQTYTTVQAAWNAIPSSIPAEDTHIIRLTWTPSSAYSTTQTATCGRSSLRSGKTRGQ